MLFFKLSLHGGIRISYMYDLMLNAVWFFTPLIPNQDRSGCRSASLQWHMLQPGCQFITEAQTSHAKRSRSESKTETCWGKSAKQDSALAFSSRQQRSLFENCKYLSRANNHLPNCSQPVYRPITSRFNNMTRFTRTICSFQSALIISRWGFLFFVCFFVHAIMASLFDTLRGSRWCMWHTRASCSIMDDLTNNNRWCSISGRRGQTNKQEKRLSECLNFELYYD